MGWQIGVGTEFGKATSDRQRPFEVATDDHRFGLCHQIGTRCISDGQMHDEYFLCLWIGAIWAGGRAQGVSNRTR
jgi:hypothetical protein